MSLTDCIKYANYWMYTVIPYFAYSKSEKDKNLQLELKNDDKEGRFS